MSRLFLVSSGPGDPDLISPLARKAIEAASDLVAYGLYIDLLGPIAAGKSHHCRDLGQEIDRAHLALELAASGKTTALISSGDIGIYAMATLVFELLDQQIRGKQSNPEWLDIDIEVIPGISAMQAASSSVGAILGHDFCTISLSDLLTPWETITKRVHSAGQGDFVVSFYNPVSVKRNWQLDHARDILLQYRPGSSPVILGRNLTRSDQTTTVTTLDMLAAADVDMFTLVCVGNSESRTISAGDRTYVYTPRGYSRKL
ncbi:MAG: precorrin-3B C(17)-methyltransferase [Granulosicoccus sp.]|nr:precorrin-3B C(17)-methyltransferase [Granulosicoccus sp.]